MVIEELKRDSLGVETLEMLKRELLLETSQDNKSQVLLRLLGLETIDEVPKILSTFQIINGGNSPVPLTVDPENDKYLSLILLALSFARYTCDKSGYTAYNFNKQKHVLILWIFPEAEKKILEIFFSEIMKDLIQYPNLRSIMQGYCIARVKLIFS